MKYFQIYAWADCPFCSSACSLLSDEKEQYMFSCLDNSEQLLTYFKTKYNWNTVPIIVLKDTETNDETFVGGYTDLQQFLRERDDTKSNCKSDKLG